MKRFPQRYHLSTLLPCLLFLGFVRFAVAGDLNSEFVFNISPQPLDSALLEFSEQAGIQLVVATNSLEGLSTEGISGRTSGSDALAALLKDTNLRYNVVGSTITVTNGYADGGSDSGKAQPAPEKNLLAQAPATDEAAEVARAASDDEQRRVVSRVEEVVVTARKREENIQDVPISITVYSAESIEARSLTNLKDLSQFTTNLSFSNHPTSAATGAIIYIRGVGQPDSNVFWDPGVGVYLDGVYMGRMQGLDFNLVDLERVEILRGPQGTLFGKNTIGGAVNVITAKPRDVFGGTAGFTVGRFDRIDVKGSVNIPLVPGELTSKLAVAKRGRDGYGKRLDFYSGEEIDEMGDADSSSGRAMINWTPSDDLGVLLTIDRSRSREFGPPHKLVKTGQPGLVALHSMFVDPDYGDVFLTDDDYTSFATGGNANDLDTLGYALTVDLGFGGWAFKSITSYREVETFHLVDPDGSPYTLLDSIQTVDQDQFSQEFQFSGVSLDDRLDWVLGLYYFEEDAFGHRHADIFLEVYDAIGLDISATANTRNRVESWSVYGQTTYALNEKLSMTTGLRFTEDDKDVTGERFRPRTGIIDSPLNTEKQSWDAVTGRIGLEYRWNDNFLGYVSAARGFKSGGINGESRSLADFKAFDPEFIWTYEAGFKSDWLGGGLRLNGAVFYSDYNDLQFRVFKADPDTGLFLTYVDNAAAARLQGLEIDLTAIPTEGLKFSAGVGYVDAEYRNIDPANTDISADSKLVETPKWNINISAEYTRSVGKSWDIVGRLDFVHKSEIHHNIDNSAVGLQDAYGLLNGRLTLLKADGNWSLALFGTNLTDERYIQAGIDFSGSLGFADVQYARPREWGIAFDYSF